MLSFVVIGIGALVALQYRENRQVQARFTAVETQIATLAGALQDSNTISEENKQELQEAINRSSVVAKSQEELLTAAVSKAAPAVVSIVISKDVPLLEVQYVNPFGNDPLYRNINYRVPVFRQVGTEKKQIGAGTGFIVRSDGYMVTNRHVVSDTNADYTALLATGEQKTARVVYRDTQTDIAILKIDGNSFPSISFGNSGALKLGQTVAAIGNALGEYNNSVSVGIISGLDRTIEAQDSSGAVTKLSGVIQTDAAINRGNSGGPLLDLNGRVVGINVAVQGGANSIGFSIPSNVAQSIVTRIVP